MRSSDRIFIQYTGSAYPGLTRLFGSRSRLINALSAHISHNGRCRSEEYMRARAACQGAITICAVTRLAELPPIGPGAEVVLLWADANGVGWRPVERKLMRSGARISVLTGRGRSFELTPRRWRMVQYRRLLEKYLVGEVLFTIVFFAMTPWLTGWDWIHGER
jgi:hypothetical protein